MKRASATLKDQGSLQDDLTLPARSILDAGMAKFIELANLNWPKAQGEFSLVQFDMKNQGQLRVVIGLVHMAMLEATRRIR